MNSNEYETLSTGDGTRLKALKIAIGRSRRWDIHYFTDDIDRDMKLFQKLCDDNGLMIVDLADGSVKVASQSHTISFQRYNDRRLSTNPNANIHHNKKRGTKADENEWQHVLGIKIIKKYDSTNAHWRKPVDNERRCIAQTSRGRCKKYRMRGYDKCWFHEFRIRRRRQRPQDKMPSIYTQHLNPTLEASIEAQLALEGGEQFNLLTELALFKHHTTTYIKLFSAAEQAHRENPTKETLEAKINAGELMNMALEKVASMSERAAKIHYTSKNTFTAFDVKLIADQMTRIMFEVCGHAYQDLAQQFSDECKVRLTLPSDNEGTTIKPGDDVLQMDATIPLVEHKPVEEDDEAKIS